MQYSENIKAPHFKTMMNIVFENYTKKWDWNRIRRRRKTAFELILEMLYKDEKKISFGIFI